MIVPRRLAVLLAAVLVAGACVPLQTTTDRSPSPGASASATASVGASASATPATTADMTAALLAKTLPEAKIFDITRRMRGRDGQPAAEF